MRRVIGIFVLLALIGGIAVVGAPLWRSGTSPIPKPTVHPTTSQTALSVEEFCATCHKLPPPDCELRALWPEKIQQMYAYFRRDGSRPATLLPPIRDVVEYFMSRAPDRFELPKTLFSSARSPIAFAKHTITMEGIPSLPSTSNVKFVRLSENGPRQLLICDMRHGIVGVWTPSQPRKPAKMIARVPHPSQTQVVDFDGDGIRDILVANLGVFVNRDTDKGSVVWLRGRGNGEFEPIPLFQQLGRVNDVESADFDGDGDLDLIVGVFGDFATGMVLYLENVTTDYSAPEFEPAVVDARAGTSDVPVVDLNGDGRLDFIALQSQQHERIVAFLNTREGRFKSEVLYSAPHPLWGSTGIRLIDLDSDGDTDVMFNHGDSVDFPPVIRPYHGLGWLENDGSLHFTYRRLAHLPGAHTAQTGDLDGDGDLDIVSSVFIPGFPPNSPDARHLDSVIWLEQTKPGQYERYSIETGCTAHPCLDLGDYDDDGDIDIVVGNFTLYPNRTYFLKSSVILFENRSVSAEGNQHRIDASGE